MREGFTTGSCATGASIASAYWHIHGEYPEIVEFTVPAGKRLRLPVVALENGKGFPVAGGHDARVVRMQPAPLAGTATQSSS